MLKETDYMKKIRITIKIVFALAIVLTLNFCISKIYVKAAISGAQEYNGHYYKIIKERNVSWTQAKQKCIDMGGHLVTITSQGEQDFIESINSSNDRFWIGGYRDASYNWYWVTGEKWNYTNWGSGEPSGGDEDCVAVWPQKWNDMRSGNLGEQTGFICEWDDYKSYSMSSDDELYYVSGSKKEYNGHSYQIVVQEDISWDEAKQKCSEMGGHLVTITSQGEQDFIESINSDNDRFWIGGYRDSSYNWYWVTGEKWNYTNWGSSEPSGGSENCAAVWPQKWNDMTSDNLWEQNGFICEWDNADTPINTPTPIITIQPTPTMAPTNTPTPKVTQEPTVTPKVTTTPQPTKAPSYKKSKLSSKKETIYVGDTVQLELLSANGDVKWSTSNKKIAIVKNGLVTGKKKGKATITATDTVTGKKYKCKVTVKAKKTSSNNTVSNTVKENWEKVAKYIKKHGDYDSTNKSYNLYNIDLGLDMDGHFFVWEYIPGEKAIIFHFVDEQVNWNTEAGEIKFRYEMNDLSVCKYTLIYYVGNKVPTLYADDKYEIKKFNNNLSKKPITIFSSDGLDSVTVSSLDNNQYYMLVGQRTNLLGYGTELIFLEKLGLTFKDLGYDKWKIDKG